MITTRHGPSAPRVLAALVCVAIAVGLMVPGGRVLLANRIEAPHDGVIEAVRTGEPVPPAALARAIANRHAAQTWRSTAARWREIGFARLALAEATSGDVRRRHLVRAAVALTRGLRRGPAAPEAWTQLAYVRSQLGATPAEVASILRLAAETGPTVKGLVFTRLTLALAAWPAFDPAGQAVMKRQIRIAWERDPERLMRIAQLHGRMATVVRALPQAQPAS